MSNFTHTTTGVLYDDENGVRKVKPDRPQEFKWLFMRGIPGDRILIGVKPFRPKHSPGQRGYLHGVVIPEILDKMGFEDSKDNHANMYMKMKERFGICETYAGKDGEVFFMAKSMKESDTVEMSRLIDGCIQWAGEFLGLTISPPERMMTDGAGI